MAYRRAFPGTQRAARASAASGGSLVDDASYSFTSNDSISAPPHYEWLGGKTGIINSGSTGSVFSRASWNRLFTNGFSDWKYSTTRTRNGTKAFRYDPLTQGMTSNGAGTNQYDVGSAGFVELYVSMNYYWGCNVSFNDLQWKMFRHQQTLDHTGSTDNGFGCPEVVDGNPPSSYWSNSTARDNSPFSQFTSVNPSYVFGDATNQAVYNTSDFGFTVAAPQNAWTRLQHYYKENSTTSTSDGIGRLEFTKSDGTNYVTFNTTNRLYRGTNDYSRASRPMRYFILQYYVGNGRTNNGNDFGDSIFDFDDVYIAWAAAGETSPYRRVEISDGVSEPVNQPITAASGTSRTIRLNQGHLSTFTGCTLREYSDATTVVTTVAL